MQSLPKISIIIPVYNVEPYIADCLQSVMRQTYAGPMECIIVDDCGTDKSVEIAEKLIEDYTIANPKSNIQYPISFRILHHEHNRGLSAARNTGTKVSVGDYVYYLDSDDYISEDCIEALVQPLLEYEYDMVVGDMEPFGGDCYITPLFKHNGAIMASQSIFDAFYGEKPLHVMAWNKLIKNPLFYTNDLTFVEGQLHEDELWTYKCCMAIETLYVQNKITYYYRIRNNSIMGMRSQYVEKRIQSTFDTIDYVLSHPMTLEQNIWNRVVFHYMNQYLTLAIQYGGDELNRYKSLRIRFDYQPLRYWIQGKVSIREVKRHFHYVLPPTLGYIYLKIRNLKQRIRICR